MVIILLEQWKVVLCKHQGKFVKVPQSEQTEQFFETRYLKREEERTDEQVQFCVNR